MKAVVMREFGDPSVLKVETINRPIAGDGQCVIQLHAAGVNPVDTYIRSGKYPKLPTLPHVLGKDGAGIVSEVGPNVRDVKIGDRVYIFGAITGSYAEYTLCNSSNVFQLPSHISFEEGACLGTPGFTAYRALFTKAKATSGEALFIHGATGGVGLAAIQLAQAAGLKVIGTAGTTEGIKKLTEMGVDAFNHRESNYIEQIKSKHPQGFDICLEMLASTNLNVDFQLMRLNGRIAIIGNRGEILINPRDIMSKELTIHGVALLQSTPAQLRRAADMIHDCLVKKTMSPQVSLKLSFEQASQAHQEIIERKNLTIGNLVLIPHH